jgi:hypothetical protein
MFDHDDDFPPWTLSEARLLLADVQEFCEQHDFALFLTGSLMFDNVGRDLDIMLMPTRRTADTDRMLELLPQRFSWTVHTPNEHQQGMRMMLFTDEDGRLIDVLALVFVYAD